MKYPQLKRKIKEGKILTGTWAQLCSPESIEILSYSGFDFLIIDTEHGYFGVEGAENLIRAADAVGMPAVVRVADKNPTLIMKALDMGAQGVMVPQVSTKEDAVRAVKAAKYPPNGNRGACPCIRAGQYMVENWQRYSSQSDENTVVILLVEGVEGVSNFEEIASTPGVDSIILGPFDLSCALGFPGEMDHPIVIEKMDQMLAIGKKNGIAMMSAVFDSDLESMTRKTQQWIDKGVQIVTAQTDKLMYSKICSDTAKALNKLR